MQACTDRAEKDAEMFGAFSVFPKLIASIAGFFAFGELTRPFIDPNQ